MATNTTEPTVLPSGRYRVSIAPERFVQRYAGQPTVVVEQYVERAQVWARCPGGWLASSLVNGDEWQPPLVPGRDQLSLDYSAGWALSFLDTEVLLEVAAAALEA